MINLDDLEQDDIYNIALLNLYTHSKNPKYSTLSELIYILDHDNFINFIKYYEGQEIKVPTKKEILIAIRHLLLYQYTIVDKIPWSEAVKKAGFSEDESILAHRGFTAFKRNMEKYNIGSVFNGKHGVGEDVNDSEDK